MLDKLRSFVTAISVNVATAAKRLWKCLASAFTCTTSTRTQRTIDWETYKSSVKTAITKPTAEVSRPQAAGTSPPSGAMFKGDVHDEAAQLSKLLGAKSVSKLLLVKVLRHMARRGAPAGAARIDLAVAAFWMEPRPKWLEEIVGPMKSKAAKKKSRENRPD